MMGYTYILNDFMDELEKVFIQNNFKNDVIGVHPPRFCLKCYSLIKTNMEGKRYHMILFCGIHIPTKGGGRKKVKKYGRPKSLVTVENVYSIDVSKPNPPAVEKMVSHAIAIKMGQSVNNIIQFKWWSTTINSCTDYCCMKAISYS